MKANIAALQLQQLVENERLGQPWEAVDQYGEIRGTGGRIHS